MSACCSGESNQVIRIEGILRQIAELHRADGVDIAAGYGDWSLESHAAISAAKQIGDAGVRICLPSYENQVCICQRCAHEHHVAAGSHRALRPVSAAVVADPQATVAAAVAWIDCRIDS